MNLFIVGAAKSGTTLLWSWLKSHPRVFFPDFKEPHYFSFQNDIRVGGPEMDPHYRSKIATNFCEYQALYQDCKRGQIRGDASPGYLYYQHSAKLIRSYDAQAKIICILRNPIDRAFSQFLHHLRDGLELTKNFNMALDLEEARVRNGWWWGFHYANTGNYSQQWAQYCESFKPEQRLLIFFDDLEKNPTKVYRLICEFLEIYPQEEIKLDIRVNDTSSLVTVPKFGKLHRTLQRGTLASHLIHRILPESTTKWVRSCLIAANQVKKPTITPEARLRLSAYYAVEIKRLSDAVKTDLTYWL
jgi:hypothetical protein